MTEKKFLQAVITLATTSKDIKASRNIPAPTECKVIKKADKKLKRIKSYKKAIL